MGIDTFLSAEFLTVLTAVTLGCFVKGALGFGLPLVATPIMLFVLPLPEIVAVLALPITIANIQQIWMNRHSWRILKIFWPLVTVSTLVMLSFAHFIVELDGRIIALMIGLMMFVHSILSAFPLPIFKNSVIAPETLKRLIIPAGAISGILGSLTSIYSFPSLQLFLMMHVKKNDLALLLGVFLSSGYIALWLGIRNTGFAMGDGLALSVLMIIPAVIGQWAGDRARRRISEKGFRHLVHFALATAGITLMMRSLAGL